MNFIYLTQIDSIKQQSTIDAGVFLTHLIHVGWLKDLYTSTLAFDIAQFFSSLNHHLLSLILNKAGFNSQISSFFSDYLINKKMQYVWNSLVLPFFKADIGVEQSFALFSIPSVLYITSIFHIFEKRTKSFLSSIPISTLSFVNNELLISQEKNYEKSNTSLFHRYNIISSLFTQFDLVIEYNKSEIFYFLRLTKNIYLPPLYFHPLGGLFLYPKDTWRYLSFFFNKKLSFQHHVHHYANKVLSTIKGIKILGNSNRELSPIYKRLLYRTCVLPIVLYSLQLWYFKGILLFQPLKELKKMQRKVALWITEAFLTFST